MILPTDDDETVSRKLTNGALDLNEKTDGFITEINVDEVIDSIQSSNVVIVPSTLPEPLTEETEVEKQPGAVEEHFKTNIALPEIERSETRNSKQTPKSKSSRKKSLNENSQLTEPHTTEESKEQENKFQKSFDKVKTELDQVDRTVENNGTNQHIDDSFPISNHPTASIKSGFQKDRKKTVKMPFTYQRSSKTPKSGEKNFKNSNQEPNQIGSGLNKDIQFLPRINSDNRFPSRKNFHNRRIFLKFVTNKIEKETEFISIIRSNTNISKQAILNRKSGSKKKLNESVIFSEEQSKTKETEVLNSQTPVLQPQQIKQQPFSSHLKKRADFLAVNGRSKSEIIQNDKKLFDEESLSKNFFKKQLTNVNSVKNVVDINLISNSSKLSGHYLYQAKHRLADLNLNEIWPSSRMYKVSIKGNPWVNAFKAKSFANEVNSNFRSSLDTNFIPSSNRFDFRTYTNILPKIKN